MCICAVFFNPRLITDHVSNVGITATVGLVIHAAGAVSQCHVKCTFLLNYSTLLQRNT